MQTYKVHGTSVFVQTMASELQTCKLNDYTFNFSNNLLYIDPNLKKYLRKKDLKKQLPIVIHPYSGVIEVWTGCWSCGDDLV